MFLFIGLLYKNATYDVHPVFEVEKWNFLLWISGESGVNFCFSHQWENNR